MKCFRSIIYRLGLCLTLALSVLHTTDGYAQKRKPKATVSNSKSRKSKTSQRSNTKSPKASKSSKTKANGSTYKGRQTQQRNRRYSKGKQRQLVYVDYAERREEKRRQDSLRLRIGGTEPIPRMGEYVEPIAHTEPQLLRFRRADSTLSMRTIESLYFARQDVAGDSLFFLQILPRVDRAIEQGQYKDALSLAEKGLHRNPMHIGLLKRACDLAHHEGSDALDTYIWQISELFHLIQNTGDGKSPQTAWRVMEQNDALLYESLWIGTEMNNILSRKTNSYQGKTLLTLTVPGKKGKTEEHYYLINKATAN